MALYAEVQASNLSWAAARGAVADTVDDNDDLEFVPRQHLLLLFRRAGAIADDFKTDDAGGATGNANNRRTRSANGNSRIIMGGAEAATQVAWAAPRPVRTPEAVRGARAQNANPRAVPGRR